MKSLIERILGAPEVELVDEDTGYDPYDRINGAG